MIEDFFSEIDAKWPHPASGRIRLTIIGSIALMLQTAYDRGTKDSDILETSRLAPDVAAALRKLAGPGTPLHKRHRIYLDIVSSGLPFLPQKLCCHGLTDANARLTNFELEVLDVVDVVVSKLKRFSANDRVDIAAMIEMERVPHDELISRFRDAVDYFSGDARAEDLPRYVTHLHQVERDMFVVEETPIELPSWL